MPIYEYSCQKCGAHIEIMQKISDKPLTRHGKCGGKLEKEWSQTSFQLKGSGWYVTDYARKDGGGKEKKNAKSAEASTSSSESSTKSSSESSTKPAASTTAPSSGASGD